MRFVPGLELGPGEGQQASVVSVLLTLVEFLSCGSRKYLGRMKSPCSFGHTHARTCLRTKE